MPRPIPEVDPVTTDTLPARVAVLLIQETTGRGPNRIMAASPIAAPTYASSDVIVLPSDRLCATRP
jgi:hypothetical protein